MSTPRSKASPRSKERGSVEAGLARTTGATIRYLRARKSAAPLKRAENGRLAANGPYLRARKSAAPLKQRGPTLGAGVGRRSPRSKERGSVEAPIEIDPFRAITHLRARKSAAPLKRQSSRASRRTTPPSPRSKERGSVEAGSRWWHPRCAGRGSPRSKERGSVEADQVINSRLRLEDLRARKSAAPLKRRWPILTRCWARISALERARLR